MEGLFIMLKHRRRLVFVYLAALFLSFHYFSTVYVNSSLLSSYLEPSFVSIFYIIGSALNIVGFIFFIPLLRRFGSDSLLIFFASLEFIAVLVLAFFEAPPIILTAFIIHQALPPLILFTLDIFLESTPHSESKTGGLRGIFLTVNNVALILSPLIVSATVFDNNFSGAYLISALFLLPLILIASTKLKSFPDPNYRPLHVMQTVRDFLRNKNLGSVFMAHLLLQLFYAWMVVYTPLYLRDIGLSWQNIGFIFTFMLLPFILFELPVGRLADKKLGEKEFMISGFIIMSASTIFISLVSAPQVFLWAAILFITRTGAALVEIASETYFFKKVDGTKADLISAFRMTRPLSFMIGPIIGIAVLSLFDLRYVFIVFGIILSSGIAFSLYIKDTL